MLNIFICEDNKSHMKQIQKCIDGCLLIHELDMKVALATHDPEAIIDFISNNPGSGLYFLDVHLKHKINGLTLAQKIREYDPRGFIVFITTHSEALQLTFKYKVEAMDFILKDEFYDLKSRIDECILNAQKRYTAKVTELQKIFPFKVSERLMTIEHSKILYFEASRGNPHKLLLHSTEGVYEFYGALNKLEKDLDDGFYRCHHSYIINLNQGFRLDKATKAVYFNQGCSCLVSARKMKPLINILVNTKRGGIGEE